MSSPLNVHHEWHRAHKHTAACVSVWFWFAGEKEEAGDKTVTLQRRYAWFHLPHRLSLSAQPTHLYVFAVISSSHLEKVAPPPHHLFILIALYLLPSLPPFNSFVSLPPFNDSGHGHPFFRALKWRVPALTENRISLKNWRVRQMWCACVYMCVHVWICLPTEHDSHGACPFVLEYTHNGSEPKYCRGKLHLR